MTRAARPMAPPTRPTLPVLAAFAAAVASSAVISVALSAAVAAIAHGVGASHSFKALDFPVYTFFIVVGLLAGATAWTVVRRRAADPTTLLGRLAPTVVAVSFVPDLVVGSTDDLPGSSWGAVTALMIMHLVVAACGIVSFRYFLPLTAES